MNRKEYEDLVKEVFINQTKFFNCNLNYDVESESDKSSLSEITSYLDSIKLNYIIYTDFDINSKILEVSCNIHINIPMPQYRIETYIDWILNGVTSIELINNFRSENNQKLYDLLSLKDITDEDELDSEITKWRISY